MMIQFNEEINVENNLMGVKASGDGFRKFILGFRFQIFPPGCESSFLHSGQKKFACSLYRPYFCQKINDADKISLLSASLI
jgi:hypothetical protein